MVAFDVWDMYCISLRGNIDRNEIAARIKVIERAATTVSSGGIPARRDLSERDLDFTGGSLWIAETEFYLEISACPLGKARNAFWL